MLISLNNFAEITSVVFLSISENGLTFDLVASTLVATVLDECFGFTPDGMTPCLQFLPKQHIAQLRGEVFAKFLWDLCMGMFAHFGEVNKGR